jgi:hypothetical protein
MPSVHMAVGPPLGLELLPVLAVSIEDEEMKI